MTDSTVIKKSFVLYSSYADHLKFLNREQKGYLFEAIFAFVNDEKFTIDDGMVQMAFSFIREDMQLNLKKWESIKEARSLAGKQGGRPKTKETNIIEEKQKKATESKKKQIKTKKADNVLCNMSYDSVNVDENVECYNVSDNAKNENITKVDLFQPSLSDVEPEIKGTDVWKAYSEGYKLKYGVLPVRNAKVNKQCQDLVRRLGKDAINVVQFYLTSTDRFYLQKTHDLGLCLAAAESLHTQWQRNHHITDSDIKQHQVEVAGYKLQQSIDDGTFLKKLEEEKAKSSFNLLKGARDHFQQERLKDVK